MTQSTEYNLEGVTYQEGGFSQQSTAVINLDVNGREYVMDLLTYNDFIEQGKTCFVEIGDQLKMVTPEQYDMLKQAIKLLGK